MGASYQFSPDTMSSLPSPLISAMAADSLEPRSRVCFSNGISGGRLTKNAPLATLKRKSAQAEPTHSVNRKLTRGITISPQPSVPLYPNPPNPWLRARSGHSRPKIVSEKRDAFNLKVIRVKTEIYEILQNFSKIECTLSPFNPPYCVMQPF